MPKSNIVRAYRSERHIIEIGVLVYDWEDEGVFYVYSPALDLTGYGKTKSESQESFKTSLDIFIDYTYNKKTIFDELEYLGWSVNRRKKKAIPPENEEMLNDNEVLKELSTKEGVNKSNQNIQLALS